MTSTRSEIRALLNGRCDAAHAKDIDRLMSLYSPGIVYFDVVPPLRYVGAVALRDRFSGWFDLWDGPIGQEIRDLDVVGDAEVVAAHMLVRASGTLQDGREVDYWVRVSNALQRSDERWLITHEHVSLPVEPGTWTAAMDLEPE